MESWKDMDGSFSLTHLYHLVFKILSDPEDPWATETMQWWNR